MNISIDSDNFEAVEQRARRRAGADRAQAHRPVAPARSSWATCDLDAARVEVDKVLELFYTPYAEESVGEVVSAERTVEGSGSAEDATKQALAKASESAAPQGAEEQGRTGSGPGSGAVGTARGALDGYSSRRARTTSSCAPTTFGPADRPATALGDLNVTLGGDLHVRKNPNAAVMLTGLGQYRPWHLRLPGPAIRSRAGRHHSIPGHGRHQSPARYQGDPEDPQHRRRSTDSHHRHAQGAAATLTSTPPLEESDILSLIVFNRPVNELGTGERSSLAATAGGIATGFIAAPLGESIGKALDLDLFEISTTTETGDLGAAITLGQQIERARPSSSCISSSGSRRRPSSALEYRLARFLRLETSAAPETTGSANRINQRRIEKEAIDLIFFFSY